MNISSIQSRSCYPLFVLLIMCTW